MVVVVTAAWMGRGSLAGLVRGRPASLPAFLIAGTTAVLLLTAVLWAERRALHRAWRTSMAERLKLVDVAAPAPWAAWLRRIPDPLESLMGPLLRFAAIARLAGEWQESGLGSKGSRAVVVLLVAAVAGWTIGVRIAGPLVALALALILPLAPRAWIGSRAEASRRRLGEQLPQMLDTLSAGLSAGLSFSQTVGYAAQELAPPASTVLHRLALRLSLGHPMETALQRMVDEERDESLALIADGILLQRQVGGDLVRLMTETAGRLRERGELEEEIRAVTAQGRLSGWVLAGLVPVSVGILLLSNPRYIDVLLETWIGQSLLVLSLALQLAGWGAISRLVRVMI